MAAPPVLCLEDVTVHQGGRTLFDGIDLAVAPRDRLALIGRNGAGKTTLLRVLSAAQEPDRGRRVVRPGARIVWLEQEPDYAPYATLRDFALRDGAEPHEVEAVADGLGVNLAHPAATASGGERRRAAIARALALQPDLLLLDEPTNHLDIAAIGWLEDRLARFPGAFIAISHDRTFLSRLTRNTLWLDRGKLRRAEVGFGGFEAWMERARDEEARAAEKLDSKLRLELHWLERGVTGRRRRNQGRLAKLNEMREARRAMLGAAGTARLGLASDQSKTKIVIDAEEVSKTFGERAVLKPFSLKVQRGDRIGIVGANGAGKTTLLRLLTGELAPSTGRVRLSPTLTGILVDQQRRLLDPDKRVRDVLSEGSDWIDVRGVRKHIAGYLKDYLFEPDIAEARLGTLSGGERGRVLLAREFARESNLLVLDEPTNDLDLETLDLLQEVIADYEGTVLIVSHDRDFLDRTVTMVIGLDGSGRVDIVAGGYADWQARRAPPALERPAPKRASPAAAAPATPRAKLTFNDARALERLPAEIAAAEAEIARLETALADPGLYARDVAAFARLTATLDTRRAALAAAEERWLDLAAQAEALA